MHFNFVPIEERLKRFFTDKGKKPCWNWHGAKTTCGHGIIGIKGRNKIARRLVYELYNGFLSNKKYLLSICNNKLCVNPNHFFISDVNLNFIVDKKSGCWNWRVRSEKVRYGALNINGKVYIAHKYMYEKFKGKIHKGMEVCHKCDNPRCVNPDHLWLGTHKENMRDMVNKKRHPFIKNIP